MMVAWYIFIGVTAVIGAMACFFQHLRLNYEYRRISKVGNVVVGLSWIASVCLAGRIIVDFIWGVPDLAAVGNVFYTALWWIGSILVMIVAPAYFTCKETA